MKDIVCIVCPNSCHLQIDPATNRVTGQLCARGTKFAIQESHEPLRTLTTSVKTSFEHKPLVSVRTSREVPKRLIGTIMRQLKDIVITEPLPRGTVIVENVADTGVSIITTSSIPKGA